MYTTPRDTDPRDARFVALALIGALILVATALVVSDRRASGDMAVDNPTPTAATSVTSTAAVGTAPWANDLLADLATTEGLAPIDYDRDDYDGWNDADDDCQSARHEVLIAESAEPVEFTSTDRCKVAAGMWIDPYTAEVMTSATDASIDHVVSLSNAHHSGAWRWPDDIKRAFGNDIDDPATLAVSATQTNSSKGAEAPDKWMPVQLLRDLMAQRQDRDGPWNRKPQ